MIELAINIGLPLGLIALAMVTGSILENRHFESIHQREKQLAGIPLLTGKEYPADRSVVDVQMVSGAAVISVDYFKRFLAGLRMIFGGELRSYGSLLDRARREAILRMKESCPDADLIINLRIETSSISKGQKNTIGSTEILAYGTALKFGPAQFENR